MISSIFSRMPVFDAQGPTSGGSTCCDGQRKFSLNGTGACGHARHAQESAEAHAPATHRFARERVMWKARQKARDRNRAFESRQRHAGALMRAGGKGQMPVRRSADVETFGVGKLRRIPVGSPDA